MKFQFKKAEQSVILIIFIQDSSATTGVGLGSLDENSSIVGGYVKRNGTGVALAVDENVSTEGTYAAPTTAGKVRIGTPANMPTGFYELHFHNDLFTTVDYVTIGLGGASDMAPLNIEIQLTTIDLNTALSASTIGTCTTNSDMYNSTMRGTDSANTVVPPTVSEMNARTLPSADYLVEGDTLARVTLCDTTTINSDMVSAAPTVNEMINTAQTEAYAAQGATGSVMQLLYMIWSILRSIKNVNTTTPDSLKVDDSTVAMSFETDSAATPTEIKRTS